MRRAARVDLKHGAIRDELRRLSFRVKDVHALPGYADLHVSRHGLAVLVEVKSPGGKLTQDELKFWQEWQGPLILVERAEEVVCWFEGMEGR